MSKQVPLSLLTSAPEWPMGVLDVAELRRQGWRPQPIQQYVVKVNSRCNLSCDYCYIYEMADQSWRSQPVTMSPETVAATCARIAEHARTHSLPAVQVVLHGGEPLLSGKDKIDHLLRTLRGALGEPIDIELGVQTNGVLLDEEFLELFLEHRVHVAVSLDGSLADNDRHRRYANGRGSFAEVARGLELLNRDRFRELFSGLLCTVNIENDPLETFAALTRFDPPSVDFLLPHANWDTRPKRRAGDPSATPYADWLIAVFEHWYSAPRRVCGVRKFDEILHMVLGGRTHVESIGVGLVDLLVIDTDGGFQQVDSLKSTFAGASETGLNVFDHPVDAALDHPAVAARQLGLDGLCDTCQACEIRDICGAGYYPHRYRAGAGFLNPSVYCADLMRLITHIRARVDADLRELGEQRPIAAR